MSNPRANHLRAIDGGRLDRPPTVFERARKHALGITLGIVAASSAIGYAVASGNSELDVNRVTNGMLTCSNTLQELKNAPTKSEALATQLPDIDASDWDQIAAVPVVMPNGDLTAFGDILNPQGPPEGSQIPTKCEPN